MSVIQLNIGSNIGDRYAQIEQAVALLSIAFRGARIRRSDFIESEPWGFSSPNPFLNLGIAIHTSDTVVPEAVLSITQAIETLVGTSNHRNPDGTYRDRHIDIDIIDIDRLSYHSPRLTLPHPRASERPFVTIPLHQLSPLNANRR